MELVMLSNPNIGTVKNVIYFAVKTFPSIRKVYFIDVAQGCEVDFADGARRQAAEAFIGPEVEIAARRVSVDRMSQAIPDLLAERVRVNGGRDRLVVDLTNGTKNMSCVLYASASLIKVARLFFLRVDRASQREDVEPADIPSSHVNIDLFDPIPNTRTIGKAGLFDICYYKDQFDACLAGIEQSRLQNEYLRQQLGDSVQNAVEYYFNERYADCIKNLGTISECLVKELCLAIKNAARGEIKSPVPATPDKAIGWLRAEFVHPVQGKLGRDHGNREGEFAAYEWKLRHLVPALPVLEQLRVLRNFAVHPYPEFNGDGEATVALHAVLYLFQIINSSGVFQ